MEHVTWFSLVAGWGGVLLLFKPHSCLLVAFGFMKRGTSSHGRTASLSRSGFLNLGAIDILIIFVVGTDLGLVGCLAASLVSTH